MITAQDSIIVGFQARGGDAGWLPVLKLVQAAFPAHQIKLANAGEAALAYIQAGGLGGPHGPILSVIAAADTEAVDIAVEAGPPYTNIKRFVAVCRHLSPCRRLFQNPLKSSHFITKSYSRQAEVKLNME